MSHSNVSLVNVAHKWIHRNLNFCGFSEQRQQNTSKSKPKSICERDMESCTKGSREKCNPRASFYVGSNTVELDWSPVRKPCPAAEMAVSIPHILELIFTTMDQETLLAARSVSQSWNNVALKELKKITQLSFSVERPKQKPKPISNPRPNPNNEERQVAQDHLTPDPAAFNFLSYPKTWPYRCNQQHSLPVLADLMSASEAYGYQFPCTTFGFDDPHKLNQFAADFLNTFGNQIKKLVLGSEDHLKRFNPVYFEDLKRLLLHQTPDLEHLVLRSSVVMVNPNSIVGDEENLNSLYNDKNPDHNLSLNLRTLQVENKIPENILTEILESSPKLTEVFLEDCDYLHSLVLPVNRLHLLQKLNISLDMETLDTLEILGLWHGGKLAVKELRLEFECFLLKEDHVAIRVVSIMSKILGACSDSLENLFWSDIELLQRLEFPVMPKLQEVEFYLRYEWRRIITLFPPKVHVRKLFPNLKTLRIAGWFVSCDPDVKAYEFFSDAEPVTSVTEISLGGLDYNRSFRAMFPNAVFNEGPSKEILDMRRLINSSTWDDNKFLQDIHSFFRYIIKSSGRYFNIRS